MSLTEERTEITYTAQCQKCTRRGEATVDGRFESEVSAARELAEEGWRIALGGQDLCPDCNPDNIADVQGCANGLHSWAPTETVDPLGELPSALVMGPIRCRFCGYAPHAPVPLAQAREGA